MAAGLKQVDLVQCLVAGLWQICLLTLALLVPLTVGPSERSGDR